MKPVWNVVSETPYQITFQWVDKLEDVDDMFYTEEEMEACGHNPHWFRHGRIWKKQAIKQELDDLRAELDAAKGVSIPISNLEFVEAARKSNVINRYKWDEGHDLLIYRTKKRYRIRYRPKRKETIKEGRKLGRRQGKYIIHTLLAILGQQIGIEITCRSMDINLTEQEIKALKKLVPFSKVKAHYTQRKNVYNQDRLTWTKQIYDNPRYFEELKK